MQSLLLASCLWFAAGLSAAHAAGPDSAIPHFNATPDCSVAEMSTARRKALEERRTTKGTPAVAADAALASLNPLVEADCFGVNGTPSARNDAPPKALPARSATEYAWLLNDAAVYFIDANQGRNGFAGRRPDGDRYCFSTLAPLLSESYKPAAWLPPALRKAVTANAQRCSAQCLQPQCVPDRAAVWSSQVSETARFAAKPRCSFDAHALQLSDQVCIDFDAGAYASEHSYADVDKVRCDPKAKSLRGLREKISADATACPALFVLTRDDQGKVATRAFPPPSDSALGNSGTACVIDALGIDQGGTRFALMGQGRDCFGGTANFSVEEIYELKNGEPRLVKKNSAGFH